MVTRCDCFLLLNVSIIDHSRHHHCHRLHCLIAILCVNGIVVVFLVIASDIFILVVVFLVVMRTVHQRMNLCAKTCCFHYNIIGFLCWLLLLLVGVLVWPSHVTIYTIYIIYFPSSLYYLVLLCLISVCLSLVVSHHILFLLVVVSRVFCFLSGKNHRSMFF